MSAFIALGALAALAQTPQANPAEMKTFSYSADHFSISLPAGWTEISRKKLDEIGTGKDSAAHQVFQYGFVANQSSDFPRILIQVQTQEPWNQDFFNTVKPLPELTPEDAAKPDPTIASMRIGRLYQDKARHMVWLQMKTGRPDHSSVQDVTGMFPTTTGVVVVHCDARADTKTDNFEQYAPVFERALTSVQIDEASRHWLEATKPAPAPAVK